MSRRPGCYVCGQRKCPPLLSLSRICWTSADTFATVGHLAENCSFSERRCFNCLEPGHESSACEAPRTADAKQCYGCGGKGHIRADCPTPASGAAKACYTCGEQGHRARDCPQNPKPVEAKEAKPVTCRNCGQPNQYVTLQSAPRKSERELTMRRRIASQRIARPPLHPALPSPSQRRSRSSRATPATSPVT